MLGVCRHAHDGARAALHRFALDFEQLAAAPRQHDLVKGVVMRLPPLHRRLNAVVREQHVIAAESGADHGAAKQAHGWQLGPPEDFSCRAVGHCEVSFSSAARATRCAFSKSPAGGGPQPPPPGVSMCTMSSGCICVLPLLRHSTPFTRKWPAAPGSPPANPLAPSMVPVTAAWSVKGRPVRTPNSTICPSPPRLRPLPPEPGRNSRR